MYWAMACGTRIRGVYKCILACCKDLFFFFCAGFECSFRIWEGCVVQNSEAIGSVDVKVEAEACQLFLCGVLGGIFLGFPYFN